MLLWSTTKFLESAFGRYAFLLALCLRVMPAKSGRSLPTVIMRPEPVVELRRLQSDLLDNYDKTLRPVKNVRQAVTVEVVYDIHHIAEFDEKNQILSLNGQLKMYWTDEFLTWDPKSYYNITYVRFSPENIWRPKIYVEYNVKLLTLDAKDLSPPITVYRDGRAEWFPHARFDVPCSAHYKHYPFDSHNCSVLILGEGYNFSGIHPVPRRTNRTKKMNPVEGTEWAVKGIFHDAETSRKFNNYPLSYQRVRLRILLERVSRMYRYVCVIPTVISMVTLLFGFWLLPSEGSRYVVGCGNIIVLSMLLQHMVLTIPAGGVVPLLAQYAASCLCMSTVFVIVTVVVNLLRECNGTAPSALLRLAHSRMDRYLCVFTFSHVPDEDLLPAAPGGSSIAELSPDEMRRRRDWRAVSVLVDRMLFWCFIFVFVVLLGVLAAI